MLIEPAKVDTVKSATLMGEGKMLLGTKIINFLGKRGKCPIMLMEIFHAKHNDMADYELFVETIKYMNTLLKNRI